MIEPDDEAPDGTQGRPLPIPLEAGIEGLSTFVGEVVKIIFAFGGDVETAAWVGGGAGATTKALGVGLSKYYQRRREYRQTAQEEAQRSSGCTAEELLGAALKDPRKLDLFMRAMQAAELQADEQTRRFYGRIAASGVLAEDVAQADAAARIFSTIVSLDPADLKVLLFVTQPRSPESWIVEHPPSHPEAVTLRSALPELAEIMDSVVARLETAGLLTSRENVEGVTMGRTTPYRVTPYARLCVEELMRGEDAGQ